MVVITETKTQLEKSAVIKMGNWTDIYELKGDCKCTGLIFLLLSYASLPEIINIWDCKSQISLKGK